MATTTSSDDGEKQIVREPLMRGRFLGRGTECTVCFGIIKYSSSVIPVAVKFAASEEYCNELAREGEFLEHVGESKQIIWFFGQSEDEGVDLFLEFAPEGSLGDMLTRSGPLLECEAQRFTRTILRGVVHLHRRGVVHCDIKPANLLLVKNEDDQVKEKKVLKIADFGSAMWSDEENVDYKYRGKPYKMPPECVKKNDYGAPVDVWALGCTMAAMVTGKTARSYMDKWAANLEDMLDLIASGGAMPEIPEEDFHTSCLEIDMRKRWTAKMHLQHPSAMDQYLCAVDVEEAGNGMHQFACRKEKVITYLAAAQSDQDRHHLQSHEDQFDIWKEMVLDSFGEERSGEITRLVIDMGKQLEEFRQLRKEEETSSAGGFVAAVAPPAKEPITMCSSSSFRSHAVNPGHGRRKDGVFDLHNQQLQQLQTVLDDISTGTCNAFDMWTENVFDIYGHERIREITRSVVDMDEQLEELIQLEKDEKTSCAGGIVAAVASPAKGPSSSSQRHEISPGHGRRKGGAFDLHDQQLQWQTVQDDISTGTCNALDMWNEKVFDIYGQERVLEIINNK